MPSPNSFTGEDLAEIYCHGNPVLLKNVLHAALACGARMAERGEFTKRAFLNNKIDFVQAESIQALTQAHSTGLITNYAYQLTSHKSSQKIEDIRKKILEILTEVEASLNFPEDIREKDRPLLKSRLVQIINNLDNLINSSEKISASEGSTRVAIIGCTNSGKSTLFNTLAKNDRAIVSNLPGTTRDFIEEDILIEDTLFRIIDTAGFEKKLGLIDKLAVGKTHEIINRSEIIIFIVDGSKKTFSEQEKKYLEKLKNENKNFITVINKSDLLDSKKKIKKSLKSLKSNYLFISALYQNGIGELTRKIYSLHKKTSNITIENKFIFNQRQISLLKNTQTILKKINGELWNSKSAELIALEFQRALECLDKITGKVFNAEILEQIFEQFCIGK